MYEKLKIGTKLFAVHQVCANKKKPGGRIKVCRLKSFENIDGEIMPILTVIGNSKEECKAAVHSIFINLSEAIDAIRS